MTAAEGKKWRPLGRKTFIAYGRRIKLSPVHHHERLEDFPPRYLVDFKGETCCCQGPCEFCGAPYRVWLTADRFWQMLPSGMWEFRLCVTCFRVLVRYKS